MEAGVPLVLHPPLFSLPLFSYAIAAPQVAEESHSASTCLFDEVVVMVSYAPLLCSSYHLQSITEFYPIFCSPTRVQYGLCYRLLPSFFPKPIESSSSFHSIPIVACSKITYREGNRNRTWDRSVVRRGKQ